MTGRAVIAVSHVGPMRGRDAHRVPLTVPDRRQRSCNKTRQIVLAEVLLARPPQVERILYTRDLREIWRVSVRERPIMRHRNGL